jgi:hypothetical protein
MTMIYSLNAFGSITRALDNGATLLLPPENNGTPEWRTYQAWLSEGNTPLPAPAPAPPGPDYIAFWDALTTSTIYTAIREQSFTSLPMNTLATEFIALIGDAKAGRANEAAIQQAWLPSSSPAPSPLRNLLSCRQHWWLAILTAFMP